MSQSELTVTEDGSNQIDSCDCCGNATRTVWGHVNHGQPLIAAYFVRWTSDRPDHSAGFDLILGAWGEGSTPDDRYAVSVLYRNTPQGAGFMIVDARDSPVAKSGLARHVLTREQVVGTELAHQAFAVLDAIWLIDRRIDEVRAF